MTAIAEQSTELAGRTAVVTGATSGIGRVTAIALAARGAAVVISGRDRSRGEAVVEEIVRAGGQGSFVAADLADPSSVDDLVAESIARLGQVDILINNAGVFPFGPTAETTEDLDSVFAVNVRAPYRLVAALVPEMARRGHGVVINVTTMVAEFGMSGFGLYGSSKAALGLLTKSWAAEFGPAGVRVNAVSPGPTRTEGTAPMGDSLDQLAAAGPAGRPGSPSEIADAIVYLATDQASFIHGAILPVDGGRVAV